uniref:Uncharacterized protein n=1 Tax=Amphilophus citrinellus TaxID=61819 RepID=A0A3Q0SBA2_AMPCI
MASAESLIAEENFLCSICLSVFTKPVSIPCGHNFCLDSKFKKSVQEKVPAEKSCLVCLMSYCQIHLEPHQKIVALKKHKLILPVENLETRICEDHGEPLDLFCRVDKMFLCDSCKDRDHKNHKIVSLEEEAQISKAQLELEKKDTDQMILVRQQKISEIQDILEANRNNAGKALSCSNDVMTAVVDYIKRSQAELADVIETKQKKKQAEAEGLMNELKGEIMQMNQKSQQLDDVSITDDPFKFLEKAMNTLKTTITREIRMLCDPDFKKMRRHAVDLMLDPDTANPYLYLSEDGKQVIYGNRKRYVPNKPERFDHVYNVLAREGFSSGRFYYEVQVKDKTQWDLGVANQSINRKGDIRLSPKNGYWTIWLRKGNEFTANAGPPINLHVSEVPEKIGVFVDYEEGEVSFYDVDTRASIFSFTGCNFTEKLFPFFSPCSNDGVHLSLCTVKTQIRLS